MAYVDVGACTDIVIASGGCKIHRIVPIGGATFTKAIADRLGVGSTWPKAQDRARAGAPQGRGCARL